MSVKLSVLKWEELTPFDKVVFAGIVLFVVASKA